MTFVNPLSKTQKATLAQLRAKAFAHLENLNLIETTGKTKAERLKKWSQVQLKEVTNRTSLSHLNQNDFLPVRAHFNSILGLDDKAFKDHIKSQPANDSANQDDTPEARTQKIHLIREQLNRLDPPLEESYALTIGSRVFKGGKRVTSLDSFTTAQLHNIHITVERRVTSKLKK